MFGTLIKKKLTDNQVANIFINALFDSVDNGFGVIAQWINEDPAFTSSPNIDASNNSEFALIVIVPSTCPQSVGFVDKTLVIVGATLSVKLIV